MVIQNICQIILQLKGKGFSILLAEQNLPLALKVADYLYVVAKGKIVYESTPPELQHNEEIKREFLAV
jgi:branched-chain amino acid transport system ATP-binding protein